jgi:TRAP-type mannitol/chloroaromatic compound transport system substrate-binding protein
MQRRKFINTAGAGMAGILAAGSAPAFAQGAPEIKWRLTSSFPKSLDTIFGAAEVISKRVAAATNDKFQIQVFASGEIVPASRRSMPRRTAPCRPATRARTTTSARIPPFAFGTAVPFGMNCRQFNAWWYVGGGDAIYNDFLKEYGVHAFLAATPARRWAAGTARRSRPSRPEGPEAAHRRLRRPGARQAGVVPQQIPGGEIYPALEKGTIDAAEWVGPYDDEKLGLNKVAKFYYYPGWWEGGPALHVIVNDKAWSELPKEYQSILEAACHEGNTMMMARYDHGNPDALKRLVAGGAQLRAFTRPVMDACYKAALELYAETAAKNAKFKKVHDHYMKYLEEQVLWFRVAEGTFDTFMQTGRRAGGGGGGAARRSLVDIPRRRPGSNSSPATAGIFHFLPPNDYMMSSFCGPSGGFLRRRIALLDLDLHLVEVDVAGLSRNIVTCFGNAITSATRSAAGRRTGAPPSRCRSSSLPWRHAPQVEEREAERRVHERRLQVHAQHHARTR